MKKNYHKFALFILAGLPAFLVAIPLNIFLVTEIELKKWVAYIFVLLLQVTINFFFLVFFVFKRNKNISILKQLLNFLFVIITLRLFDLFFYVIWIDFFDINYIIAQLINVIFFSTLKFFFTKNIIENP